MNTLTASAAPRICAQPGCEVEITAGRADKRFCSDLCSNRSRKPLVGRQGERYTPEPGTFAALLREYREDRHRTRHDLAREVAVNASYLTRLEYGDRDPPRAHIVEAIARGLRLTPSEQGALYTAAGYVPPVIAVIGWDDVLGDVARVLGDPHLSDAEKDDFRTLIRLMGERFRPNLGTLAARRVAS